MTWLVESAAYDERVQKEMYGEYCRIWPAFVRFTNVRKTRNTVLMALGLLGLLSLMGLLPFHVWLLFLAFPPLLLLFPVLLVWGGVTWPWKHHFYKKVLLSIPGKGPVAVQLGERTVVLCQGGREAVRALGTLKRAVRTELALYLFWDNGKLTPLPFRDFVQGDPEALVRRLAADGGDGLDRSRF